MLCECGGVLVVTEIEEDPKKEKSNTRLCNVVCSKCGKKLYGQAYDSTGLNLNVISSNAKFKKI